MPCYNPDTVVADATAVISEFPGAEDGVQIFLDDVKCSGAESNILSCPQKAFQQHNCKHSEDAGVRCSKGQSVIFYFFSNTVMYN